ncbi:hypothetical protein E0494_03995 [Marinilabiliaceae bacterium JC040]|nr:hypothetical protein [Marinilabiliaceae bacterium JC040]
MIEVINEILKTTAWPIVSLITLFALKAPISDLIRRFKKIGYDKAGIEIESQNLQKEDKEKTRGEILGKDSNNENIEKALAQFRPETIKFFEKAVKLETSLDSINTPNERVNVLYRYSQVLYLIMHFNKIYDSIFGSQLRLLQSLNGGLSENKTSIRFFYENAKERNPKFYENYSYDQYLEYLKSFDLIIFKSDVKIEITTLGIDFLKYIIETGLSIEKLY